MYLQVTTGHEWHDEIKALISRKEVIHVDQVWMVSFEKHLELTVHRFD